MSGDWRKAQQTPMRQNTKEPNSPFMRTAFGYSPPAPNSFAPQVQQSHQPQVQQSHQPQLPLLSPQAVNYQAEYKNTPTSVLMPTSEAPQQLRGRLMTIQGEQRGESWFLNRSHTSLGRALDNDIILLDIAASRKHAQIIRGTEGFILLDLRSANGIFLNGRRITEEDLYDGDEIEVGETILKFETVGEARIRSDFAQDDTDPGMTAIPHHQPTPLQPSPPELPYRIPNAQPVQRTPRAQAPFNTPSGQYHSSHLSEQGAQQILPAQNTRATGRKKNHLTYGFGSQLSPEDLNLAPIPRQPKVNTHQWPEKFIEQFQRLKTELTLGRGRRASILRLSTILVVAIAFFTLGQGLSALISSPLPSQATLQSPEPVNKANTQIPTPVATQVDADSIQQLTNLLANQEWAKVLKLLEQINQNPPTLKDPRLKSFRNQAEQGLIQRESPLIKSSIQKGTLGKAQKLLSNLKEQISIEGQVSLISLSYALWLHQKSLGSLEQFNPPPSEQRLLTRAAREQESGQYRKAQRTLKRGRPAKARQPLFSLRKEALNANKKSSTKRKRSLNLKEIELKYLLATPINIQSLLQRYKAEIEKAVIKTQYKRIAPWLEGAIILSINQPIQQYFLNKQQKLQREAMKWLSIASSTRNANNPSLRRALLESAIPYLQGQNLDRAEADLRQLR